jgi:HSP20 family protein
MITQTQVPAKKVNGTVAKAEPFDMFGLVQEEMDRIWRWPWITPPMPFGQLFPKPTSWAPRMDVYEKDNALIVKAELPGVKKEDVQIELDNGALLITGEAKGETEVKRDKYYRMERTYGTYFRRLPLPFEATPEQIQATLEDGVLEIHVARPVEAKPEATKIAVG